MSTALHPQPALGVTPYVLSREFDAPRDLVWDVFTKAEHLTNWFAPGARSNSVKTFDFRPGGLLHYAQTGTDGLVVWGRAIYLAIEPKDRIVFIQSFSDEHAGISAHAMAPDWPREMHCVYRFEDIGKGRTRFTLECTPATGSTDAAIALFNSMHPSMDSGWKATFENLDRYLGTLRP